MGILKPTNFKRILFFVISDILCSFCSLYLAYFFRFNYNIPENFFPGLYKAFIILTILKIIFLFLFKVYFVAWRFFSLFDAKNIFKAHICTYILFTLIFIFFPDFFNPFPRSIIFIDFAISMIFIGTVRISKRIILEKNKNRLKPTLIIGANHNAQNIIKSFFNNEIDYYPVAILENSKNLVNTYFSNLKIFHMDNLENIVEKFNIKAAIVTKEYPPEFLNKIFERLKNRNVNEIKKVALFQDDNIIEDISIEDLLARKPKDLDETLIANFIKNKKVLITGAGGSIGSEIARQCYNYNAKSIVLLDNSEFNLYKISEEIPTGIKKLISVTDKAKLENVFKNFTPEIVIHAAAYKHVHLCEENIDECIENNVSGSKNVIDVSIKFNVKKLVIISTDKAVRPTSVMGASKRVVEIYAQNIPSGNTEITAVRFGNVLGSSGSVIPKFKEQILSGGPITVTHPEVTRYFMLIPEACKLVLQAAAMAKGGELFILDMGKPVKISDLAKKMAKLYHREDIEIKYTGLRKGEKLYEELLISSSELKTKYESIFIAQKTEYDFEQLKQDIEKLITSTDKKSILKKIVPEYQPYE